MVDYSKGKIYKVLNDLDDDVYIGSTCQSLNMRMVGHRKARTGKQYKNYKLYRKMNEIGVAHFYIELIKETPCENKEQLRAIEGEYIRKYGTLNGQIAGRSRKEWQDEHQERKSELNSINYQKHREKVLKRQQEYRENHPEEYKAQKKKSYQNRKEKILAQNKERVECEICGKELSRDYLRKH